MSPKSWSRRDGIPHGKAPGTTSPTHPPVHKPFFFSFFSSSQSLSNTHTLSPHFQPEESRCKPNLCNNPTQSFNAKKILTNRIPTQPKLDWEITKCLCIFCLMRLFKHGSSGCGCWRCYSCDKRTSRPTFARIPIFTTVLGKNRFSAGRSAPLYELDAGVSGKGDPSSQPASSQRACHLCQQSPKP
jgi:hypothetical protein